MASQPCKLHAMHCQPWRQAVSARRGAKQSRMRAIMLPNTLRDGVEELTVRTMHTCPYDAGVRVLPGGLELRVPRRDHLLQRSVRPLLALPPCAFASRASVAWGVELSMPPGSIPWLPRSVTCVCGCITGLFVLLRPVQPCSVHTTAWRLAERAAAADRPGADGSHIPHTQDGLSEPLA